MTHMIRAGRGPFHNVSAGGKHIHHLVWGILILLGVGFGWLVEAGNGSDQSSIMASRAISLLYGARAALTLDEVALLLNLEDVYWAPEGRTSIDATIMGVMLAGLLMAPLFVGFIWLLVLAALSGLRAGLRRALADPRSVIATGSGVPMDDGNWRLILDGNVVVNLSANTAELLERIGVGGGRPLASGGEPDEVTHDGRFGEFAAQRANAGQRLLGVADPGSQPGLQ